jgi:hypothetical protein
MKRRKRTVKNFECVNCHHCKTRIFEKIVDLTEWCGRKSVKPNKAWLASIAEYGWLRLIWCEMQSGQFNSHGFSPRNACPRHAGDIRDVIRAEKKAVAITNHNKDSFIAGPWDICPYYMP